VFDRKHLGTEDQSTLYAAELSGIEIALARAIKDNKETPTKAREVILFSDSQAAIQALQNPQRPSGQYVLTLIYNHLRDLRPHTKRNFRWIPAHVGVPGNEAADVDAKNVAFQGAEVGGASDGAEKPMIRLAAAAKRAVRFRIKLRWE
jgi:ribonuclease HI